MSATRPGPIANHSSRRRSAFTRIELIVVIVIILVLSALLAIGLRRWRSISLRADCANNVSGIGKGLYTFANSETGMFPIASHAPAVVTYAPGKIGVKRGDGHNPKSGETAETDTVMSVTRNLWEPVRLGWITPPTLICPASDDRPNEDPMPQLYWDVRSYSEISYGYQVPYGDFGQPSTNRDARMPVVADKGPYGAALEAGKPNPGPPAPADPGNATHWRPWNSPNHGGDGQVVLFIDSHVEFATRPDVGIGNDNIYTRWSAPWDKADAQGKCRRVGTPPTSNETPWGDTDTLIYP